MSNHATTISEQDTSGLSLLKADRELFRSKFDKESFEFAHNLPNSDVFRLERLVEIAQETQKVNPGLVYCDVGVTDLNLRWAHAQKPSYTVAEMIERIHNSGAWIILRQAEKHPELKAILQECMNELQDFTGIKLRRVMKSQGAILFITSPKRITTYHIDRECSLLLQIRGDKTINVFDRNDRNVLSEEELETFWSADNNAARYKPATQDHARVYALKPGRGVHIPVNCPHWLQNGDDVSVSLNVNFQYRDVYRANAYRANYLLRKAGLKPTPPGRSSLRDTVKSYGVMPAVWAYNMIRGRKPWS